MLTGRRRNRTDPSPRPLSEITSQVRPDLDLGRQVLRSLFESPEWQHRKVESLKFSDGDLGRRRLSIDCSPLAGLRIQEGVLVPLGFLEKAPLSVFDITDADGMPLPLLGRKENGFLAWSALCVAMKDDLGGTYTLAIERSLKRLVLGNRDEGADLANDLLVEGESKYGIPKSVIRASTGTLLQVLSQRFLLVTIVRSENQPDAGRQIIKYSYHWEGKNDREPSARSEPEGTEVGVLRSLGRRALESLDFIDSSYDLDVSSAVDFASYHLEVHLPQGLKARTLELPNSAQAPGRRDESREAVLHVVGDFTDDRSLRRADLRFAQLTFRVSWAGARSAAFVVSGYTFAVYLLEEWLNNARPVLLDHNEGATSLLLLVPAVIGVFSVRPGENPPLRRLLIAHRAAAWISCAMLVVAAWTLVGSLREPYISSVWRGGAYLTGLIFAVQATAAVTRLLQETGRWWRKWGSSRDG